MTKERGFAYLIAALIKTEAQRFSYLIIIVIGMALLPTCSVAADSAAPADPGQEAGTAKFKGAVAAEERATRFYDALERLMNAYGEDHTLWPDNRDKRLIQDFLEKKDALTLNNCVFGSNLLGLGIGESSKDAEKALKEGAKDAWGNPYSLILAGGRKAPKLFELIYAIGVNRGVFLFNRDICEKVFVFLKADLHSLFADVFKNFNGESVLIMAREVQFIGAPGSVEAEYVQKLGPALCAADSLYAAVYIGENDPVTTIIPNSFRDKMYSLFGMILPDIKGKERISDQCLDKKPPAVKLVLIRSSGHDIPEYYQGMKKYGTTMLKK